MKYLRTHMHKQKLQMNLINTKIVHLVQVDFEYSE